MISINIWLKFIPKGPINNIPALVEIMAWCRPGDKPYYLNQCRFVYCRIHPSFGLNEFSANVAKNCRRGTADAAIRLFLATEDHNIITCHSITSLQFILIYKYLFTITLNHLAPSQNVRRFEDDTFKCTFFIDNYCLSIQCFNWHWFSSGWDSGLAPSRHYLNQRCPSWVTRIYVIRPRLINFTLNQMTICCDTMIHKQVALQICDTFYTGPTFFRFWWRSYQFYHFLCDSFRLQMSDKNVAEKRNVWGGLHND